MKKIKVLFIPETYPSGLAGTSVKTRNTIEYLLSEGHEVDVACIHFSTLVKKELVHKNLRIFSVYKEGLRKIRIGLIKRLFELVFSIKPVRINRMFDKKLGYLIETLEYSNDYDYVFFDGFSTLQYATIKKDYYIYIDDEDITDLIRNRMNETSSLVKKTFLFTEYLRCLLFEKKFLQRMVQIWAICPNSLKRLKTLSSAKSYLMPTLVPVAKNVFDKKSQHIVFTGTLSWSENNIGLKWFIKNCWDNIHKQLPNTKLYIVGQQGDSSWKELCSKYKNIELLGYVKDLADIYKKSAVAISPIFINVGIKIKVLTYLSYGLPVISIKESTWGMDSRAGILCATKENFSERVVKVLKHSILREKMSAQAQKNMNKNHSKLSLKNFFIKTGVFK
jgi:polysaccharide biosynthesis protein PslH